MDNITLPNSQLELPYDLVENILKGKTLFFVGAGISVNAGLPMFTKLAKRIVRKASSDGLVSKNKSGNIKKTPDEMLDLLERRIGRTEVITHLQKELKTKKKANINTHKAILKLASLHDKNIIITTNFDDLFDKAQNTLNDNNKIQEYIHPNLPNNWELGNSLIYIHGKLNNIEDENLILTQSDFSRHYMLKNHANFIIDIFYRYQVVFLGYSADDAMLKHLLLAMENDNSFKVPYLLVSDQDQENWKFYSTAYYKEIDESIENKGVVNLIPFLSKNNFIQLHDGLTELSEMLYDTPIAGLLNSILESNNKEQANKLCKFLYIYTDNININNQEVINYIESLDKENNIKLLHKLLKYDVEIKANKEYYMSKDQKTVLWYLIRKCFQYVGDYETYNLFSQYIVEIKNTVDHFSYNIKQEINKIENVSLKQLWLNITEVDFYLRGKKYSELSFIEQQKILKYELRFLYDDILLNQIFKWEFEYSTNTEKFKYRQYNLKDIGYKMPFSKRQPADHYNGYLELMDKKLATEFLTEFFYNFDKIIAYSESNSHEFNIIEHIFTYNNMSYIIDIDMYNYKSSSNILILNCLLGHEILPYIDDDILFKIVDKHIFYLVSVIIFCIKNKEKDEINNILINKIVSKLIHNILNTDGHLQKHAQNLLLLLVNYFPDCMTEDDEDKLKHLDDLQDKLEYFQKNPINNQLPVFMPVKSIKDDNLLNELLQTDSIDNILEIVSNYSIFNITSSNKYEQVDLCGTGKTYSQQQNIKAFSILLYKNINFTNNNIQQFIYGIFKDQSSIYGKDVINKLYLKLPKDICKEYMYGFQDTLDNMKDSMLSCDISKLILHFFSLNIHDELNDLLWYMINVFDNNGNFYHDWLSFIKKIDNEDSINTANNALIEKGNIYYLLHSNNAEFDTYIKNLFSCKDKEQLIERYKLLNIKYIDENIVIFVYKAFLFLIQNSNDLDDHQHYKFINFLIFSYQKSYLEQSQVKEFLKHCNKDFLLKFTQQFDVDKLGYDGYIQNVETHKKDIDFIIDTFPREQDKRPNDFKNVLIQHFGRYLKNDTHEDIIHKEVEQYINKKLHHK